MKNKKTCLLLCVFVLLLFVNCAEANSEYELDLIWQTDISGEQCEILSDDGRVRRCNRGIGIQLMDGAIRGDRLSYHARRMNSDGVDNILIDDLISEGFKNFKKIELQENYNDFSWSIFNKDSSKPVILDIAADDNQKIWVVGYTDRYHSLLTDVSNRHYFASLDSNGKSDFEKRYNRRGFSILNKIKATKRGDFIVAGSSFIGRVDPSGNYVWKNDLGMANDKAFVFDGERILVVGLVRYGDSRENFYENYEIRLLELETGNVLEKNIIWENFNTRSGSHFGNVDVLLNKNEFYVFTRWGDKFFRDKSLIKPIKISKLSASGEVLWQRDLESTLGKDKLGRPDICAYPTMTMFGDDVLMACELGGNMRFYTFKNGEINYTESVTPLPECHDPRVAKLELFTMPHNEKVYLVGTRSSGNVGASCSWIGQLTRK